MARARRRRRRVVFAAVVVVLVAAVIVRTVVLNDEVHRVTPADALHQYHEHTTTSGAVPQSSTVGTGTSVVAVAQSLPPVGVYVYRTVGTETIDAVGGSTHTYPDETTMTVIADGCGVLLRWDVLKERRERWLLCATDEGIAMHADGAQSFHEFFGQTQVEDLTCDRDVVLVPSDDQPRGPVGLTCLLGEMNWQPVWEVLERGQRTIGTTTVDVQHVRMTITDDDQYFEHITLDWYLDEHGLPIVASLTKESLSDTAFGDVTYTERYSYEIVSLTPLR